MPLTRPFEDTLKELRRNPEFVLEELRLALETIKTLEDKVRLLELANKSKASEIKYLTYVNSL